MASIVDSRPQQTPQPGEPAEPTQPTRSPSASDKRQYGKPALSDADKELGRRLFALIKDYEYRDQFIRDDQLRLAKKGEYFFRGYHHVYWDATINDIRDVSESPDYTEEDRYYTKVINIYRAHCEAIIAALSAEVPAASFPPMDAEDSDDLSTSKAYTDLAIVVQKHNKAQRLLTRALYILCTQGLLAGYNYTEYSHKYGSYDKLKFQDTELKTEVYECPICGAEIPPESIDQATQNVGSFNPETKQLEYSDQSATQCPDCGEYVDPEITEAIEKIPQIVGVTKEPKSRQCMKVYGVTHVKVTPQAVEQDDIPYLTLEYEIPYSRAKAMHPKGNFGPGPQSDSGYERFSREPSGYEEIPNFLVTYKQVWFRCWALYEWDVDEAAKVEKRFPDGIYACFINGECCEIKEQDLDDHWTIHISPTSAHIHPDPIGKPLFDVNDMQNELVNLTLQTVEHGIPETFVDTETIDGDQYAQVEARPGMLTPVNRNPGDPLSASFYQTRTATLSDEIKEFSAKLDQYGQLVVGAFPTIYGGTLQGGSRTYAEYSASRQQALQRLSLAYNSLSDWWVEFTGKAVVQFHKCMVADEYYNQKIGKGNYLKLPILRAAMMGEVGDVEPEVSNSFPMSMSQKRDFIMELLKLNSPQINEALFSPENSELLAEIAGIPELNIPGSQSRAKQFAEIRQLVSSEPITGPNGQPLPTVMVDPDVDDHEVEIQVCRYFLQSEYGQTLKVLKPLGYQNILLHLKQHLMILRMQAAQAAQTSQPGVSPQSGAGTQQ